MGNWRSIVPEEKRNEIFSLVEKRLNEIAEGKRSLVLTVPYFLLDCEKSRE